MRIFVLVVGLLNLLLSGSALFLGSAAMAGSIVSWGREVYGQVSNTPTGTGYTAIAGGSQHSLALAVHRTRGGSEFARGSPGTRLASATTRRRSSLKQPRGQHLRSHLVMRGGLNAAVVPEPVQHRAPADLPRSRGLLDTTG